MYIYINTLACSCTSGCTCILDTCDDDDDNSKAVVGMVVVDEEDGDHNGNAIDNAIDCCW